MSAGVRQVDILGGPRDGQTLTVATLVRLPEKLAFVDVKHSKRYIYRAVEQSEGFMAYEYERCEQFGEVAK